MSWLAQMEIGIEAALAIGATDSYDWHKRLWACFPDAPEDTRDFLTRIDPLEGSFRLWLLAVKKPVCPSWCPPENFRIKEIAPAFFSHKHYAFDLRANPTKMLVCRDSDGKAQLREDGKRKRGKRIPLVKPEDLRAWIIRKANIRCRDKNTGVDVPGGFRIADSSPLEISPMIESHFQKKEHRAYHGGVQYRGVLEVIDKAKFIDTYHEGVGSAKGFGFGLLLLSPVLI